MGKPLPRLRCGVGAIANMLVYTAVSGVACIYGGAVRNLHNRDNSLVLLPETNRR